MAFSKSFLTFTAKTSTGAQVVSFSGSFKAKFLKFRWTGATATGAGPAATDRSTGNGFSDGTNNVAQSMALQDGSSISTDRAVDNRCVSIVDNAGSVIAEANVTSIATSGEFTINWDSSSGNSEIIQVEVWGGSDLTDVAVGSQIIGTGSTTDVTQSFEFDGLYVSGIYNRNSFPASNQTVISLGFADGVGTTNQYGMSARKRSGSQNTFGGAKQGRIFVSADDTAVNNYELSVTAKSATKFTLTKNVGGTNQAAIIFAALKGLQFKVGAFTSPTATAPQTTTQSSLGFDPELVDFTGGGNVSANAFESEARFTFGAMSSATNEHSAWQGHADTNQHDSALKTDKSIMMYDAGTPTLNEEMEFSSFGTAQWVGNWTTTSTDALQYQFIAVGPAAGGGTAFTQAVSGVVTPVGALTSKIVFVAAVAGSIAPAGSISKKTAKAILGSIAPLGLLVKKTSKTLVGTTTPTGDVLKLTKKAVSGSTVPAGSLVAGYKTLQSMAGTITPSGTVAGVKVILVAAASKIRRMYYQYLRRR